MAAAWVTLAFFAPSWIRHLVDQGPAALCNRSSRSFYNWSACNFPIYNVFTAQVVYILKVDRRAVSPRDGTFDCRRVARIRTPGVVLNHLIVLARPKAAALWLNLYAPTALPDQHSGGDDIVAARSLCRGTNPSADHA